MKVNCIILALKISFLLSLFAATTFYFQYVTMNKACSITCSKDRDSEKNSNAFPVSEEESENEKSSSEEEEQDDDRTLHHLVFISEKSLNLSVTLSTVHLLDFKEIHFEIVTPPPQI